VNACFFRYRRSENIVITFSCKFK